MRNRQYCTPHLVGRSSATALERVVLDERSIKESWFQDLLFKHPSLIPIDEIEPIFGPMIPLAREMSTGRGAVDVVYVSPSGFITLVETKLFRNPEARREVVAQILDYATAISRWTYEDLCDAVRARRSFTAGATERVELSEEGNADPIKPLVRDHPDYDEARFIDNVSHNLERGRFLLLIAGDGIQSGVEHLAETLARTPHLGFSLALVELAVFKSGKAQDEYFVQPRVLARTKEVVRAVIELRAPLTLSEVKVSLPEMASAGDGGDRRRLTEEIMFETIGKALGSSTVDQFREFLGECEKLGIEPEGRDASVSLFWYEPNTGRRFSFASVYADGGRVSMWFVRHNYHKCGLDPAIGLKYVNAVAALVPGAKVVDRSNEGVKGLKIVLAASEITLAHLMPKSAEWLAALQTVIRETEAAGSAKASTQPESDVVEGSASLSEQSDGTRKVRRCVSRGQCAPSSWLEMTFVISRLSFPRRAGEGGELVVWGSAKRREPTPCRDEVRMRSDAPLNRCSGYASLRSAAHGPSGRGF